MSQRKMCFISSLFAIGISAVAILFVPYASELREDNVMWPTYVVALVFWIGLVICYGLQIMVYQKERCKKKWKLPAVMRFFSNPYAVAADIILLLSLILVFLMNQIAVHGTMAFFIIAVCYFSFHMHCLLNGANYRTCIHS